MRLELNLTGPRRSVFLDFPPSHQRQISSYSSHYTLTTLGQQVVIYTLLSWKEHEIMTLSESILCSTFSPSPNSGSGSIALHDIQTGTTLATFKQTNAQVHGTAVAQSKYGYGGFMLTAQHDKPIMNVYNFQKVCGSPIHLFAIAEQ